MFGLETNACTTSAQMVAACGEMGEEDKQKRHKGKALPTAKETLGRSETVLNLLAKAGGHTARLYVWRDGLRTAGVVCCS